MENIYLTLDEIQRIYSLDLSDRAGLDRVRDVFVIGCYTGLRFSDLNLLRPENIINDGQFVRISMQRQKTRVCTPEPTKRAILTKTTATSARPDQSDEDYEGKRNWPTSPKR